MTATQSHSGTKPVREPVNSRQVDTQLDQYLHQRVPPEATPTGAVRNRAPHRSVPVRSRCACCGIDIAFGRGSRAGPVAGQRHQGRDAGAPRAVSASGVLRRCRGTQLRRNRGADEHPARNRDVTASPRSTTTARFARFRRRPSWSRRTARHGVIRCLKFSRTTRIRRGPGTYELAHYFCLPSHWQ
jgi:hypothetical protein